MLGAKVYFPAQIQKTEKALQKGLQPWSGSRVGHRGAQDGKACTLRKPRMAPVESGPTCFWATQECLGGRSITISFAKFLLS